MNMQCGAGEGRARQQEERGPTQAFKRRALPAFFRH